MKCLHCDGRIDGDAWFCPHCKRSVREARLAHRRRRLLALLGGACAASAVVGAVLALQAARPQAAPRDSNLGASGPLVSIQENPVIRITPSGGESGAILAPSAEPSIPPPIRTVQAEGIGTAPEGALQPPIAPQAPELENEPGTGSLTVTTDRSVRTFVYLDGGKLLGIAPLRNAAVPAGRHTLVFWAPSIQGRASRTVDVPAGGSVVVTEEIRHQSTFAEGDAG